MDNKINTNYDKFYTFLEKYVNPDYEVIALNVDVQNAPSIFSDLRDLVENLPETHVPELYIYEVDHVEIDKMMPVKHGICIKSKRFKIDSVVNLFTQDPEVIKNLPSWLVLKNLQSESGENATLKEFALNKKEHYGSFRAKAVEHLCVKDLSESELIELLSDEWSEVRYALMQSVDAVKHLPDYALRILSHDANRVIYRKAYDLLEEREKQE